MREVVNRSRNTGLFTVTDLKIELGLSIFTNSFIYGRLLHSLYRVYMRTKGLACFVILSLIVASWVSASPLLAPVSLPGENLGVPDQKIGPVAGQGQWGVQGSTQAIPLQFVKNAGQSGGDIEFIVLSDGGSLFFSPSGVTIKLVTPEGDSFRTTGLAYSFQGADPTRRS